MEIAEAKRRAKAGPAIMIVRRGFALIVAFVSTVTVARIVPPTAYGLANMSTVIFAFAGIFRDFGLTNAVLRKGHVSQAELSLIFWFNAAMTVMLTTLVAIAAPFAATFYNEPIVKWVTLASLIGFMASGLTLQHRAIINRDLRFTALAVTDTVASVVGLVITVILAFQWRNVWALVIGGTVQTLISSAAYVWLSKWNPGRFSKTEEFGSLLKFGGNSSVYSISIFISQNISSILIGHMFGPALLGQYSRAQALLNIPTTNLIQPIAQAALPLMARLRPHPAEYRLAYLALTKRLCLVLLPLSVALTFASSPLVEALLGRTWSHAGYVLMALSPVLAVMGLVYSVGDLFVTQDRSAELRNLGLVELVIRVGSICIGLYFGLVGAAAAFTIGTTVVGLIRICVAGRSGPVSTMDQFSQVVPALPLAAGALIGGASAVSLIGGQTAAFAATAILGSAGLASLVCGLLFAVSRHALFDLAELFGIEKLRRVMRVASRN